MIKYIINYTRRKKKMKVKVFIDLDDTLANTSSAIAELFNYKNYEINGSILKKNIKLIKDLKLWKEIKKNNVFWEDLPVSDQAQKIIEEAYDITKDIKSIYILTALPKLIYKKDTLAFNNAAQSKLRWVEKNFPMILKENIIVVHAKDKKNYAQENSILFDDSLKNIKGWKKNGGIAYLVTKKGYKKY